MKYDILIFDCDNLVDIESAGSNTILLSRIPEPDALELARLLVKYGANVSLRPVRSEG